MIARLIPRDALKRQLTGRSDWPDRNRSAVVAADTETESGCWVGIEAGHTAGGVRV